MYRKLLNEYMFCSAVVVALVAAYVGLYLKAFAQTTPTAETLTVACQVLNGSTLNREYELIRYNDTSRTANLKGTITPNVAAAATDVSLNLNTYIPGTATLKAVTIRDRGGTGIKVGLQAGAGKMPIDANGVLVLTWLTTQATPTLYFDNPSTTAQAYFAVSFAAQQ